MKTLYFSTLLFLSTLTINSQDITGQWQGALKIQGTQLRLVFNISKKDNGYTATMDSPDQGAKGIPVSQTFFENPKLTMEIKNIGMVYTGEVKANEITGTFTQNGYQFPLNLSKNNSPEESLKRPQEPKKPYPYYTEDVTFENPNAQITLAGTLSLPKKEGHFPAVVLITGSGPQNRDEELMGHKPFAVIADYLTRNGIAVLRFDDRGTGQSKGNFKDATTADFATDVESAFAYLKTRKEINKKKIGLIGHSEGGIIAPMVASQSKDVHFIVLLAGTGIPGGQLLLLQQEAIGNAAGASEADIQKTRETNQKAFDLITHSTDQEKLKTDLTNLIKESIKNNPEELPKGMTEEKMITMQLNQVLSPWMQYFIKYDPATALEKVKCPVLAVNGDKDLQVPAQVNLNAIETALKKGGNKKITLKQYPGLNHLFQECKTGLPSEYATIEQTFSPVVLEEMTNWIAKQTK